MSTRIVVLGGALSGPTAAARARETDAEATITLIERADDISYAVGGLPYYLSGEVEAANDLAPYRAAFFKKYYDIDVRTGVSVIAIDPNTKTVETSEGTVAYDRLIYALGAGSIVPDVFGAGASNLSLLRNMSHLRRIVGQLESGAKTVAIVGGGFYGVEAAECLAIRGCKPILIESRAQVLSEFSKEAAGRAVNELEKRGVRVLLSANIDAVHREGERITGLQLGNETLSTDLIIVSAGVRPRTQIFQAAGGKVRKDGSIRVDSHCRTNLTEVFATSICVAHRHAVSGKAVWTAQAADADKTAQIAGANAAGGKLKLKRTLGTAIVRVGELTLGRTGLTGNPKQGVVSIHSHSADPFFKGSAPLDITLFFDRKKGRVQGAEVVGKAGVDKRIDVLATAITGKLDVHDLAQLDLAYSPPYGLARDPINAIGNIAKQSSKITAWTAEELAQNNSVLLLDVRSNPQPGADSFEATAVDISKLAEMTEAMRAAEWVVFISDDGREGYLAAQSVHHLGIKAGYLSGGMKAWRQRVSS